MALGQKKQSALTDLFWAKKRNAFRETSVLKRSFLKSEQEEFSDFCRLGIPSVDVQCTLEGVGVEGITFLFTDFLFVLFFCLCMCVGFFFSLGRLHAQ